jgi:ATP:ADP antiporter, AAA family
MLLVRSLDRTERTKAALLGSWFFLTVAALWLLKSLRVASLLAHLGARETPYVRLAGVAAVAVTVVVYSVAVRRISRVNIVRAANVLFAAAVVLCWALIRFGGALASQRWFVWSVYVLVDVYAVVMIEMFWTYTSDVVSPKEADRLYGVIGLGGIVGGAAGGLLVDSCARLMGASLLLVAAGMMLLSAVVGSATESILHPPQRAVVQGKRLASALEGIQEVKKSRYLMLLVGIVVAYEVTATLTDFSVNVVFERANLSELELTKLYGRLGWIASGTAALAQIVLVPLLLPAKRIALLIPPVVMLASVVGAVILPVLATAFVMVTVDHGLNYSLHQSTRESLYVPLTDAQKYNAKAFIDMFVDRAAKAAASVALLGVIAMSNDLARPALVLSCGSMFLWIRSARRLGAYAPRKVPVPANGGP